jgi:hypothetical protein
MFHDTVNTIVFPDDKFTLVGRYLGPATDVGSALMAKMLKQNGQYVCRLTLCHLTPKPKETLCMAQIAAQSHFNKMIIKRIGRKTDPGDVPSEDLTPEYKNYCGHTIEEGQDNTYKEGLPNDNNLDPLPTPEVGDSYISAEVLLPMGGVLAVPITSV